MNLISKLIFLLLLILSQPLSATTSDWVSLLAKVDPETSAVAGQWNQTDEGLFVNAAKNARLQLGVAPEGDYDVSISFTRKSGVHSIAFIFTINGKQAGIELDAWGEHLAGIQMIDNQSIKQNITRVNDIRLENNRTYTLELKVRGNIVSGLLDGEQITQLDTSKHQLSVLDLWRLSDSNSLGIGAYESATVFHEIKIRNVNTAKQEEVKEPKKVTSDVPETKKKIINDDLNLLSDEFDNPNTLKNWQRVYQNEGSQADQLERIEINEKQGKLALVPYTSSWYEDYRGVLVYKPISGDFIVKTRIRATGRDGQSPPAKQYSLAGIMIRTPREVTPQSWQPGNENYIFLSLGTANQPGTPQFEVKTTINSNSKLEISQAQSTEAEIKVIRAGSSFILMKRESGGNWNVHRRYHRPDMPDTLQVGMTVYTDWQNVERISDRQHNQMVIKNGSPDLLAEFDYFRFKRPVFPEGSNKNSLSDSEVLSLFSD